MAIMELAVRCEQAMGPDRKLEIDILSALGLGERIPGSEPDGSQDGWHNPDNDPVASKIWNCTASIDAAMSLVPEGWVMAALCQRDPSWFCRLETDDFDSMTFGKGGDWITEITAGQEVSAKAATPALALCAAALRSRAMKENGEHGE